MTIQIFIKRKVKVNDELELTTLLKRLRCLSIEQPGYISGETLRRVDRENECMVISTWSSREAWGKWYNNKRRIAVQSEIDDLLGEVTNYAIYED